MEGIYGRCVKRYGGVYDSSAEKVRVHSFHRMDDLAISRKEWESMWTQRTNSMSAVIDLVHTLFGDIF
jgi:hypothetical protein